MHEPGGGTPLDVWTRAPYSSDPQAHPLSCQWPPFPLPLPGEAGSVLSQPRVFLKAFPSPSTTPVHRCRLPQQFSSGTWLAGSIPLGAVAAPVLSLQSDPSADLPRPSLSPAYLSSFSLHSLLGSFGNLIASTFLTSPVSGLCWLCTHPPFFLFFCFLFILYIHIHTHTFHILIIQIYFQCRKTRRYR